MCPRKGVSGGGRRGYGFGVIYPKLRKGIPGLASIMKDRHLLRHTIQTLYILCIQQISSLRRNILLPKIKPTDINNMVKKVLHHFRRCLYSVLMLLPDVDFSFSEILSHSSSSYSNLFEFLQFKFSSFFHCEFSFELGGFLALSGFLHFNLCNVCFFFNFNYIIIKVIE